VDSATGPNVENSGATSLCNAELRHRALRLQGHILIGLLVVEGILVLCDRFRWFGFDEHKGWTGSMAVLCVAAAALLLLVVRRPRWHQFSLRSLLIFTLIVAIASDWLEREAELKRQERDAVAAIVKGGGVVEWDYQWNNPTKYNPNANPPGPDWLRGLFGENFFARVRLLSFAQRPVTETDVAAANLDRIAEVRVLYFNKTGLTDAGLAHVKGFDKLEVLSMNDTRITDAGLSELRGLSRLRHLSLNGTGVSDAGLAHIKALDQLETLELDDTKITNAGLINLRGLSRLRWLTLHGTGVFDAALPNLKSMTNLLHLGIARTRITAAGAAELKNALPKCHVNF
jgi:hypothetical protein